MPEKTVIGHMHLHVSNLANALAFYSEALGLNLTCLFPGAHFFAADKYHHHIGANTWLGEGVPPAAPEKVGLNHFGIALPVPEIDNTTTHLESKGIAVDNSILQDPDGIKIRLYTQ
jgi:catechol 2,3-dioxygenase